jgi:hypothetical protein
MNLDEMTAAPHDGPIPIQWRLSSGSLPPEPVAWLVWDYCSRGSSREGAGLSCTSCNHGGTDMSDETTNGELPHRSEWRVMVDALNRLPWRVRGNLVLLLVIVLLLSKLPGDENGVADEPARKRKDTPAESRRRGSDHGTADKAEAQANQAGDLERHWTGGAQDEREGTSTNVGRFAMAHRVERDWVTDSGLRAVCLVVEHRTRGDSHRCGYVCVLKEHPLHGVDYGDPHPSLVAMCERLKNSPMAEIEHLHSFTRMLAMLGGDCANPRPDFVFSVHGGITYAGGGPDYPAESDGGWWFGFDCNHCDDGYIDPSPFDSFSRGLAKSQAYVEEECESLAAQLMLTVAVPSA